MKKFFRYILPSILIPLIVISCSGGSSTDEAAVAVEVYFQALVDRDRNGVTNIACLAWEEQAHLEFDSFSAVNTKVDGLNCQVTNSEGDYAVVECQGIITANYGSEDQEFELAGNHYQAFFEDGEWRMCGYH